MPKIELLCFGTELLKDKINSNSVVIAEQLSRIGLCLNRITTVGDCLEEMESCLSQALNRADCILTCGGLGPTFDDLTREVASKVLKKPLVFHSEILIPIQKRFNLAGRKMPEENRKQAYIIKNAVPILNSVGTAPGQIIVDGKKCLVLLPGPPKELIPMMRQAVCPYLKKKYKGVISKSLILHIFGAPESEIDEKIEPIVRENWNVSGHEVIFGILAHKFLIDVKVAVKGKKEREVGSLLRKIKKSLMAVLKNQVYGENEETLESVVGKLLMKRDETCSVAESCTGGLIANKITDVSGSSKYFKEGVVAYSNESKIKDLSVRKKTLRKYGAVSEETAKEMAVGIRKKAGSDWGVSVTGIAGPAGGTAQKPIGLVCFGLCSRKKSWAYTRRFSGTREDVKEKSALNSLDFLRRQLLVAGRNDHR